MKKLKLLKNKIKVLFKKIPFVHFMQRKWDSRKNINEALKWFHDNRDPKENKRTTPPKLEKIELHCAWITEVFTPSNINTLTKSLKMLGWDNPKNDIGRKNSLSDWIKQGRSKGGSSSWINGGIILTRNDKSRFIGSNILRTKLPSGVDYCSLSLQNITSSITLVTIQFVFKDEISNSINEPLNTPYKTISQRKSSGSISFINPTTQKRKEIKHRLNIIHTSLYSWFNKNLPGHYSSGKKELPTIDLITSTKYKQPKKDENGLKDHYTDLLFDNGTENWTSKDDDSLELRLQLNNNNKPVATIFGNFFDLTKDIDQYGGANRAGLTNKLNTIIDKTLGLWVTHHLLLSCEKHLSAIRDKAISPIKRTGHAFKNLNYVRSQFLSISTDVQVISHDVANLVKSKSEYSNNCVNFAPPNYYKKIYPDFLELLRQHDEMRSKTLIKLEIQVNQSINASVNLTSAIVNLRIQRNILWFTIIIMVLTIIIGILSYFSIFKSDPLLNQIYEKLSYLIDLVENFKK